MSVAIPTTTAKRVADDCVRLRLHDVDWTTYVALRDHESNNHVRMTYDRGELLLASPRFLSGRRVALLSRLVATWTEWRDHPLISAGRMTMREEALEVGLEPDNCFWIAHESQMRHREDWESGVDPPPDLVVEVDVTSDSLVKLGIYAGLRVPEVWHHDGERLRFLELVDGEYEEDRGRSRFRSCRRTTCSRSSRGCSRSARLR